MKRVALCMALAIVACHFQSSEVQAGSRRPRLLHRLLNCNSGPNRCERATSGHKSHDRPLSAFDNRRPYAANWCVIKRIAVTGTSPNVIYTYLIRDCTDVTAPYTYAVWYSTDGKIACGQCDNCPTKVARADSSYPHALPGNSSPHNWDTGVNQMGTSSITIDDGGTATFVSYYTISVTLGTENAQLKVGYQAAGTPTGSGETVERLGQYHEFIDIGTQKVFILTKQ